MFEWLNLGSLVFGLIAWILPVVNLMLKERQDSKVECLV